MSTLTMYLPYDLPLFSDGLPSPTSVGPSFLFKLVIIETNFFSKLITIKTFSYNDTSCLF